MPPLQTLPTVFWGKSPPHTPIPLGAFGSSIVAPAALDLGPQFGNPGSATDTCGLSTIEINALLL